MTIADWMFAHPWMTFFILLALASSISDWIRISITAGTKERKGAKDDGD